MERSQLARLVAVLGREFVRRRMHAHAGKLRVYYLALRRGLATTGRSEVDIHWSEELVVEWLKLLRIPPYESAYRVRTPQAPCSRCKARPDNQGGSFVTERTFPGGWKVRCINCGEVWLVLEEK